MEGRGLLLHVFCLPTPSLFTPAMQAMGAQLGAAVTSRTILHCDTVPYLAVPGRRLRDIYQHGKQISTTRYKITRIK